MKVIPAVDLLDGKLVSLFQGDFERREIEEDDPLDMIEYFKNQGAQEIHVVDLNGARQGQPENEDIIQEILQSFSKLNIQVGGGIRSINTARRYLHEGADAVIVGTAAVKNPYLIGEMIQEFGSKKVIASLDAKDGELALSGWEEESGVGVKTQLVRMLDYGVNRIIYTDINRDGTLAGPNINALKSFGRQEIEITVSGGISSQEELKMLEENGIDRAIVGTALYKEELDPENIWEENNVN